MTLTNRQMRCGIYAILAVLTAVDWSIVLGPLLFLLLIDAIGG